MTPAGISVLTPTRGRPETLLAKAQSMLTQELTRDRFEWIVAFDGPDPSLAARLEQLVAGRVQLVTVPIAAAGPGPARDAAARHARFEVLYLSDDDCLLETHTLARHLEAQSDPALYLGDVVYVTDDGQQRWSPHKPRWWNLGGANASLPREAFVSVGGFGTDTVGYGGEDLWLGWRLKRVGVDIRWLPDASVRHLGPDPQHAITMERARQAGANAARIAALEPALSWRLGVHPSMLAAKLLVLPWVARLGGRRVQGDLAYSRGAWREIREGGGERS